MPWLQRLCGAMSEPSTAVRGVESWIASLAATHASHSASPASAVDRTILGTFGPASLESLRRSSPASCSSRMSQDTSLSASMLFAPICDPSASELRLDCLRRRKSARRTGGSGCSSSACPMVVANEGEKVSGPRRDGDRTLTRSAMYWPTPRTITGGGESGERKKELGRDRAGGGDLQAVVDSWSTPRAATGAYTRDGGAKGSERLSLEGEAQMWATPDAQVMNDGTSREAWERFVQSEKAKGRNGNGHGETLAVQAQSWQTPQTPAGGGRTRSKGRSDEALLPAQADQTTSLCSRPDPATSTHGDESSPNTPASRPRLSPPFVAWLMGLPPDWMSFAATETPLSPWLRRWRSCLFGLVCGGIDQT